MQFKIRHETKFFLILGAIALWFVVIFAFGPIILDADFNTKVAIPLGLIKFSGFICALCIILYLLERAAGTTIVVERQSVTIKYLFGKNKIPFDEISFLDIEPYDRYRAKPYAHYDYRMRMTIKVFNKKDIVLTDNATSFSGVRRPDEDVNLYKAYQAIRAMRK